MRSTEGMRAIAARPGHRHTGSVRGSGLLPLACLLLPALAAAGAPAEAQVIRGSSERPDARPVTVGMPDFPAGFTFCRLHYDRTRRLRSGLGWSTDYPAAEHNFMARLEELTTTSISFRSGGDPGYAAVRATDPDLFRCPFLFMSDPGSYDFSEEEVRRLREYFLKGGFMWADDLWDDMGGWAHLRRNLQRILPEYEIVELTADHPLFSSHYVLEQIPQIPSLQHWRRTRGTSEVPGVTDTPRMYAVLDEEGRIMVLVSYNTDIADGWEREGDQPEFFRRFSPDAYAIGINVALWVMSR